MGIGDWGLGKYFKIQKIIFKKNYIIFIFKNKNKINLKNNVRKYIDSI